MKAVRVHEYHVDPSIDDIPEPTITAPLDVIIKVGGAGVCRTDLHILEGQWAEAMGPTLPYVIGHENAGWVAEIGAGVTNVAVGDTVILHPQPSCGLCLPCRAGRDMQCQNAFFPGLSNNDGGMADMTVLDYAMMVEDSHVETRIIEYRRRTADSGITGSSRVPFTVANTR